LFLIDILYEGIRNIKKYDIKKFATIHLPEHNDAADLENMYSFLA
jgi:hypothetical protein